MAPNIIDYNVKDEFLEDDGGDIFECDLCNFKTNEDIELITHFQTIHSEHVDVKQEQGFENNIEKVREKNMVDNDDLTEKLQTKQKENKNLVKSEQQDFGDDNEEILGDLEESFTLQDRQKSEVETKTVDSTKNNHKEIKKEIDNQKYFNCQNCDKVFENKSLLDKHVQNCSVEKEMDWDLSNDGQAKIIKPEFDFADTGKYTYFKNQGAKSFTFL